MDNPPKLGELRFAPEVDDLPERDAIHVAVILCRATETLQPGQRVALVDPANRSIKATLNEADSIGVVDPFLRYSAWPGSYVWVMLYPGTITSLRHEWVHPAFDPPPATDLSRRWLEAFAAELDLTYNRLMEAADDWVINGDWTQDNSEAYKNVNYAKWPLFWKHYKVITGREPVVANDHMFTCSC